MYSFRPKKIASKSQLIQTSDESADRDTEDKRKQQELNEIIMQKSEMIWKNSYSELQQVVDDLKTEVVNLKKDKFKLEHEKKELHER